MSVDYGLPHATSSDMGKEHVPKALLSELKRWIPREMINIEWSPPWKKGRQGPALELIHQLRVFAHGKRLDFFYNSGCLLALKNIQKKFTWIRASIGIQEISSLRKINMRRTLCLSPLYPVDLIVSQKQVADISDSCKCKALQTSDWIVLHRKIFQIS